MVQTPSSWHWSVTYKPAYPPDRQTHRSRHTAELSSLFIVDK